MKNTLKLCMISLLVLAGVVVLSCTDGTFEGTGGNGNLNIIGISSEYNNKYCEAIATGTGGPYTFNPTSSSRVKISNRAVKAPLYASAGTRYTGSAKLTIMVSVYENETGGSPLNAAPKIFSNVQFYTGSALVDWN